MTASFAAAAKLLQPGQLIKDEYFTLFEAVGALEVRPMIWMRFLPIRILPSHISQHRALN